MTELHFVAPETAPKKTEMPSEPIYTPSKTIYPQKNRTEYHGNDGSKTIHPPNIASWILDRAAITKSADNHFPDIAKYRKRRSLPWQNRYPKNNNITNIDEYKRSAHCRHTRGWMNHENWKRIKKKNRRKIEEREGGENERRSAKD